MRPLLERFNEKWEPVTETGCWLWTAGTNGVGYGVIGLGSRLAGMALAHRVSYEMHKGPIPPGLQLDHLCRVRCCVNPDHLEPVTHRENCLRGVGASAANAKKTHCPQGHPYNEENTYTWTDGSRRCRVCGRESKRRSWLRGKQA